MCVALAAVGLIQLRTNKCFKFSTKPPKNCIEKTCTEKGRKREKEGTRESEHRVYIIKKVKINKESTL